jgi:hypothetical protein
LSRGQSESSLEYSHELDDVHDSSDWRDDPGRESRVLEFANGVSRHDESLNADFARSADGECFRPSWACEGQEGERAALGSADVFRDVSTGWPDEDRAEIALVVAGLMVDPVGTVVMQALSGESFLRTCLAELGAFVEDQAERASNLLGNALAGFSSDPDSDVLEAREVLLNMEDEARAMAERRLAAAGSS